MENEMKRVSAEVTAIIESTDDLIWTVEVHKQMQQEILRLNSELESRVNERTYELQNALNEIETFTYTVSHDLKSPLRSIETYSRILLEDHLKDCEDDQITESTRQINRISNEMIDFINKLLLYAAASRIEIYEEEINVNDMIRAAFAEIVQIIPNRDIELIMSDEIPPVMADKVLIKQVFTNILSNSVKFTRTRRHAVIEVNYDMSESDMTLSISDNGIGFDAEASDRLFDSFHRLQTANNYEGTGIGLATARRIIQRHGGLIWIEGEIDKGASVYITLPY